MLFFPSKDRRGKILWTLYLVDLTINKNPTTEISFICIIMGNTWNYSIKLWIIWGKIKTKINTCSNCKISRWVPFLLWTFLQKTNKNRNKILWALFPMGLWMSRKMMSFRIWIICLCRKGYRRNFLLSLMDWETFRRILWMINE